MNYQILKKRIKDIPIISDIFVSKIYIKKVLLIIVNPILPIAQRIKIDPK